MRAAQEKAVGGLPATAACALPRGARRVRVERRAVLHAGAQRAVLHAGAQRVFPRTPASHLEVGASCSVFVTQSQLSRHAGGGKGAEPTRIHRRSSCLLPHMLAERVPSGSWRTPASRTIAPWQPLHGTVSGRIFVGGRPAAPPASAPRIGSPCHTLACSRPHAAHLGTFRCCAYARVVNSAPLCQGSTLAWL